jgi:signal transduction histidine kinase
VQSWAEANNNLLGLVSHELRTLLHTIQGAANLLRNMPGVPNDLTDNIATGVHTLGSQIDQRLDVAPAGSSHCHLATKMFDRDSALMTALAKHSAAAAENGVNMLSIVGNVPS